MFFDEPKKLKELFFGFLTLAIFATIYLVIILLFMGDEVGYSFITYHELVLGLALGAVIGFVSFWIGKFTKLFKTEKNYRIGIAILSSGPLILFYFVLDNMLTLSGYLLGVSTVLALSFLIRYFILSD